MKTQRKIPNKDPIASVHKNIKQMQQQAQIFIQKHNTNLPPICSARHYLFHSLSKKLEQHDEESIVSTSKPQLKKLSSDRSQLIQKPMYQPTVYNLQFRNFISAKPQYTNTSTRTLMNSTSMRMKMSQDLRLNKKKSRYSLEINSSKILLDPGQKSRKKLNSVVMNSQTIDMLEENVQNTKANNMFSPRPSKASLLSKKQQQILGRYYSQMEKHIEREKAEEEQKSKQEIAEIEAELKNMIATRKKFKFNTIDNPELMLMKKSIYYSDEKGKLKGYKLKRRDKQAEKREPVRGPNYTPWQANINNQYEDFLSIDKF